MWLCGARNSKNLAFSILQCGILHTQAGLSAPHRKDISVRVAGWSLNMWSAKARPRSQLSYITPHSCPRSQLIYIAPHSCPRSQLSYIAPQRHEQKFVSDRNLDSAHLTINITTRILLLVNLTMEHTHFKNHFLSSLTHGHLIKQDAFSLPSKAPVKHQENQQPN